MIMIHDSSDPSRLTSSSWSHYRTRSCKSVCTKVHHLVKSTTLIGWKQCIRNGGCYLEWRWNDDHSKLLGPGGGHKTGILPDMDPTPESNPAFHPNFLPSPWFARANRLSCSCREGSWTRLTNWLLRERGPNVTSTDFRQGKEWTHQSSSQLPSWRDEM